MYVVSDDHAGLRAARRAVLPGATWQRCPLHPARNAIHHAPTLAIRRRIGAELRRTWNAATRDEAEAELRRLVAPCADAEAAPDLAAWLGADVPDGLAAVTPPELRNHTS